jgi:hypothetical protein
LPKEIKLTVHTWKWFSSRVPWFQWCMLIQYIYKFTFIFLVGFIYLFRRCNTDCVPSLVDVVLTNKKSSCFNTLNLPTGVSDCHNLISTILRVTYLLNRDVWTLLFLVWINVYIQRCTTFERIGPTFERKKSYVWAQKNPRLSAFYLSYPKNWNSHLPISLDLSL